MQKDIPKPHYPHEQETSSSERKKQQPAKILPVEPPKVEYEFTCPRCGSHLSTESVISVAKMGGTGIGFARVKVCRVCGFSQEYKF